MPKATTFLLFSVALSISTAVTGCSPERTSEADGNPTDHPVSFTEDIKPLLQSRCVLCHNTGTLLGHLNLETRALAFAPGPAGPFIIPGSPEKSKLYTFTLKPRQEDQSMPPTKHRLSDEEKGLLRRWIAEGAPWPEGPGGHIEPIPDPTS
ncbi:MAG: c-type cytochrome domain-containing protein [Verrucomicrobiales bacterium]